MVNKEATIFYQNIFTRYFPYWPLFAFLALTSILICSIYLYLTPPTYESVATILIKDERKGAENPSMTDYLTLYKSKKLVENEIEIIKSKSLLTAVISDLNLNIIPYKPSLLGYQEAFENAAITLETEADKPYAQISKLLARYDSITRSVHLLGTTIPLNQWTSTPYGKMKFIINKSLDNTKTIENEIYFDVKSKKEVLKNIERKLTVSPNTKLSTVIILSYRDNVPARSELILNKIIETYGRNSDDDKNSLAEESLRFLNHRIAIIEKDLDTLEFKIQSYKSNKGIVDLSEQAKVFLQNVGDNDRKLSELTANIAVLNKTKDYVINKNNNLGIVPSTIGLNNPVLERLIAKLYDSQLTYERLKNTTAINSPILVSLQSEIESMRPGILENIENQMEGMVANLGDLKSTSSNYHESLQGIPKQEKELLEITRQHTIKNNVYTFLLQKREETALSYASITTENKIIDLATSSTEKVAPKKAIIYAAGMVLAIVIGILNIMFKETLSSKILFRKDIEEIMNMGVVAEISNFNTKKVDNKNSLECFRISEQFKQLRMSLGLFGHAQTKIIMVTSSISGEGKSFVAYHLAQTLSNTQKKVLLIDFDLRRPMLTNLICQSEEKPGLSDMLLDQNLFHELAPQAVAENLFFYGAGQLTIDPTTVLLNGNLGDFLDYSRTNYSYVIIDTPPIDPVMDGYIINDYCDLTVFVTRHGVTPKIILDNLSQNSSIATFKNAKVVFNGVKARGLLHNKKGYGYGKIYDESYLLATKKLQP